MVAREEVFVFVEQTSVAARVARRGDDDEVSVEARLIFPFDDSFDAVASGVVVRVHDSPRAELAREPVVVGHVVAVREEDRADAAHRFNPADERAREARRVNEDAAALGFGADYQITPRAEARLRGEAAEVDVLFKAFGESLDADARVIFSARSDG